MRRSLLPGEKCADPGGYWGGGAVGVQIVKRLVSEGDCGGTESGGVGEC